MNSISFIQNLTRIRKMILLHILLWVCGIILIIAVSKVVFFGWFIISAFLLILTSSYGIRISTYIRNNYPEMYLRRSSPNRMNLDGKPAVNLLRMTHEDFSQIADESIRRQIRDMAVYTKLFLGSFVLTLIFVVSCQTLLPA